MSDRDSPLLANLPREPRREPSKGIVPGLRNRHPEARFQRLGEGG